MISLTSFTFANIRITQDCNDMCLKLMKEIDFIVVKWNIETFDWKYGQDIDRSISVVVDQERNLEQQGVGPIVLMHDRVSSTAMILLPRLLEFFHARGYEFVSVGDCQQAAEWNMLKRRRKRSR